MKEGRLRESKHKDGGIERQKGGVGGAAWHALARHHHPHHQPLRLTAAPLACIFLVNDSEAVFKPELTFE